MVPGRVAPFHLLFALVIEMLAISVRKTPEVGGICWGLLEEKISLYADDALVYFNGTEAFFRGLMRVVEGFGVVSGFKVVAFPIPRRVKFYKHPSCRSPLRFNIWEIILMLILWNMNASISPQLRLTWKRDFMCGHLYLSTSLEV